ncbi:MAG: folylpolyglutamate synthase/dihydrofolate synthase family protein [Novosphingobium sp.]
MKDFATSESPAVQAQLDRLAALSLPQGRYGLETIREILRRLDEPQRQIPPTFHVAGTNGKGSTCAYLRAILEAQGLSVHAAIKPHLVRYNERIRLAGELISDQLLAALLKEVLDLSDDLAPSFFEVTTAAMFLAFARSPADVCVIEVGLGGRFDATNVLETAVACGIASLGIDHEAFLLRPEPGVPEEPLERIAFEKASIASAGVPLVTQDYGPTVARIIRDTASGKDAPCAMRGVDWWTQMGETIEYRDAKGELTLPLPALAGAHQADNAALAVAMLQHQGRIVVSPEAMAAGIRAARWPARLQLLGEGPLTKSAPEVNEIWLDGGHNPDAARAITHFFANRPNWGKPFLIIGMLASKDAEVFIRTLAPVAGAIVGIPISGHEHHAPSHIADLARQAGVTQIGTAPDLLAALSIINKRGRPSDGRPPVLIAGSLYLAGEVLKLNCEMPD